MFKVAYNSEKLQVYTFNELLLRTKSLQQQSFPSTVASTAHWRAELANRGNFVHSSLRNSPWAVFLHMPNWKLFHKVNLDNKWQTTDYFLQINWLAVTTKNKVGICICFLTHDADDTISRQVFTSSHFWLLKYASQRQNWFCILFS